MIKMPRRKQGYQGPAAVAAYTVALEEWCQDVITLHREMNLEIGVREWNYIVMGEGSISKGEFESCEKLISACRKNGRLPITICADDIGRPSTNEELVDDTSVEEEAEDIHRRFGCAHLAYVPLSFWENQKHYVEMGVEKIGVHSLYDPVCEELVVRLTNLSGWTDINRRAQMMERFAFWEARGKIPVLLYCGDHDPDGLRISDTLRKNFEDLEKAVGWSPDNLIIDRFGLNYDFIQKHRLVRGAGATAAGDDQAH
jgi:hypothetical protein